jgi:hypothetical protein
MALTEWSGVASHVRDGTEIRGAVSGGAGGVHGGVQTRQVLTFRVEGRPVEIKLTSPATLADGDRVRVIGKERNGILRARAMRNETTGAVHAVEAWRLYGLGACFMILGLPAMAFPPVGVPVFLVGPLLFRDSYKTTQSAKRLST